MRADYDAVVSEALDVTLAAGLKPRAIGLMALSLGGYYGALATVSGPSYLV